MEQIWQDERVIAVAVGILLVLGIVITQVIRTLGRALVHYVEQRTGLTQEQRRRSIADDVVAAVEQMAQSMHGERKLERAQEMAEQLYGASLDQEEIEAALKRAQGWVEWPEPAPMRWEGND